MTTQEVRRKLTAILSADVKGYSRLMGEDEEWTVHTLNAYKQVMRGGVNPMKSDTRLSSLRTAYIPWGTSS